MLVEEFDANTANVVRMCLEDRVADLVAYADMSESSLAVWLIRRGGRDLRQKRWLGESIGNIVDVDGFV